MIRVIVLAAILGQACTALEIESALAQTGEHAEVVREACGAEPRARCLAELRNVCHERITFRCYYSRKGRLDAIREVGFPHDRSPSFDE